MRRYFLSILLIFVALFSVGEQELFAQQDREIGTFTVARIVGRDTIPHVTLGEVQVFAKRKYRTKGQQRRWTKYIYNVKRALPYARIIAKELKIINAEMENITDPLEREAYLDKKETELFDKYEDQLKHLTIRQGRILIKLVDRETGETCYNIIKTLKGDVKVVLWQGVARLFGSNLRSEYDAEDEDKYLENVVLLIDKGYY